MGKSEATPTATKGEGEKVMVLTMLEVDPATEDPDLLDAIRKKNSAALTSILDPRGDLSAKDSSNAAAAVWYFVMNGHHITGNLNLLTDLTPVCDRWVRSLIGTGPPMQVCARGSVNCNGIKLDDVWYVPGVTVNMVAGAPFSNQEISLTLDRSAFSLKRPDGTVVGKGCVKGNLYEVDFLDISSTTAPWYIVSNAAEHMTGNLHLLSNFTPTQPGRPVRTHTGGMLQVRGKGSLSSTQLSIPSVSYVPGLTENIISVTQLTDSGFSVAFSPHGCNITRNRDGKTVGSAYHAGGQLYRLDYLRVADNK
ncbi:uncharacterized protein LOC119299979 [Triticum dicoccoides]|uniref:Retrovirus-related Pol polyprotein from transposon TNT 1-94-like beta-barrel domain-containing protein n=1 Tax=Triticum turgidum subsp. durum TaxID=4567 RepID=A0A9R0WKT2_TRITD|nr:uncharacterized protein LOC119299979 [Triticum dicoccoides]XP_044379880.1 uncharacterized protein LOC123102551 isoform X1 [Triticum aestivum]VAI14042.1 unnamed protein product [Triticum turgidum subsp. durum]